MVSILPTSGRNKTLNTMSGMPKVSSALNGWFMPVTLIVITQVNNDGDITNQQTPTTFKGTVQPLKPEIIALKPEGQRSFEWLQIHSKAGQLNLSTNDRVRYASRLYKVMEVLDYSLNDFVEYHLVRDYE